MPSGGTSPQLGVLDLTTATPVLSIHPPPPSPIATGAVAVGTGKDALNRRLAAVGLASGDVALATLTPPAWITTTVVDTRSSSAVGSLTFAGGNLLVATKPGEDVVLGIDLSTGKVLWAVPAAQPVCATVHDGLVWVGQRAESALLVIDPATGRQVNSVRVGVSPGTDDGYGGVAFKPGETDPYLAQYLADTPYIATGNPQTLLGYSLGIVQPMVATTASPPVFTMTNPYYDTVWSAGADAVELAYVSDVYALPGRPRRAAFDPSWLVVGTDAGVSLVESRNLLGGQVWAGASLDSPMFDAVGFLPSGSPYAVVQMPDSLGVRRYGLIAWTIAALQTTGSFWGQWLESGSGPDEYLGSVLLEDGLWIFRVDSSGVSYATRLDPAWEGTGYPSFVRTVTFAPYLKNLVRSVALGAGGRPAGPLVSPNRRTFVHWEDNFGGGTDLYVRSADPDTTFEELSFTHFAGRTMGLAFDDKGERLFVVTRDPDALLELR
jgi:hypothetical protein